MSVQNGNLDVFESNGRLAHSLKVGEAVQEISWSPDEKAIALATHRGNVILCSFASKENWLVAEHTGGAWSVAYSPDGSEIASAGEDGRIILTSVVRLDSLTVHEHRDEVMALAWTNEDGLLAFCNDGTCLIFKSSAPDHATGESGPLSLAYSYKFHEPLFSVGMSSDRSKFAAGSRNGSILVGSASLTDLLTLEGHTDSVLSAGFAVNDTVLVSESKGRSIKFWDVEGGAVLATTSPRKGARGSISVHGPGNIVAVPDDRRGVVDIFNIDTNALSAVIGTNTQTFCSAKVALVGESNVGKSCLALRIAENRYEESGTTHGMRFWPVQPGQLNPDEEVPQNEKRDVVLWDMGGQDEYRLIHQLFLHDTTAALVLLDPTRGRTAFEEAEGWAKRLEKQIKGRHSTRFLVGTKLDVHSDVIDRHGLERLITEQQFAGYFPTSAKTGQGVRELCVQLSSILDWKSLARTSRPLLFQTVRDEIENARSKQEVVLLRKELDNRVRAVASAEFDGAAVTTVISQLALQGVITVTRLSSGEQALVLQVEQIEIYAGSILVAAKNNPRNVPAIREDLLMADSMIFPGIPADKRLQRAQERIVIESVVQLFVEHGICLEHEGLLIFPSLFVSTEVDSKDEFLHSVSLYYDFSGAIDNIYSSLISAITMSDSFGSVRLWDNRAEFTKLNQGTCGLRKIARQRGFAHLDVYVGDEVSDNTRDLFISVVEEHLARHGVDIFEHIEITCQCGQQFDEATVRKRIIDGHPDVGCPICDRRVRISEGAKQARQRRPDVERSTWALRSRIRKAKAEAVARTKRNLAKLSKRNRTDPIRILHLSDLHFTPLTDIDEWVGPLCADLKSKKAGLGIDKLDYLVVSGDVSDRAQQSEFEKARAFLSNIIAEFGLNVERCILVPGNHDINWEADVYEWVPKRKRPNNLATGEFVAQGDGFLVRKRNYDERLKNFSEHFYHPLLQQPYPLGPAAQALNFFYPEDGIQFVALNSCWELDEYFPQRSSIHKSAPAEGLRTAEAVLSHSSTGRPSLRIGVWHHPATGNEKIVDDAFLSQLKHSGVRLALHGHVHEDRAEAVGYIHPSTRLCVVGAGSFSASANDRPESTPRLYNLMEVSRRLSEVRVHTRCLRRAGGAWEGWAVWPGKNDSEKRTYYDIQL
ncbi:GTP-binding protein [Bradyrhizobium acaciae]|uniref:GTP-binding protein n=1 Tax=Bradyrhizobium acaciae TaxID=2683706 RepID=UPI00308453A6|nr:GTP-binding protein [Bradyrhizobium acaciae]